MDSPVVMARRRQFLVGVLRPHTASCPVCQAELARMSSAVNKTRAKSEDFDVESYFTFDEVACIHRCAELNELAQEYFDNEEKLSRAS